MTNEQFAYWLQGYAEICGETPTPEQWQVIKDHLQTTFLKVTPDRVSMMDAIKNYRFADPLRTETIC